MSPALCSGRTQVEVEENLHADVELAGVGVQSETGETKMTGTKHDKEKIRPRLIINSMARALKAVAEVGTFGANKYADDNWMEVPDGINRYTDAMYRHLMAEAEGEYFDTESKLLHAAHAAWNSLARLDLILRERENVSTTAQSDVAKMFGAKDFKFSVESEEQPKTLEFACEGDGVWFSENVPNYIINHIWNISEQHTNYVAIHAGHQLSGNPFKEWQEAYDRCQQHYQNEKFKFPEVETSAEFDEKVRFSERSDSNLFISENYPQYTIKRSASTRSGKIYTAYVNGEMLAPGRVALLMDAMTICQKHLEKQNEQAS